MTSRTPGPKTEFGVIVSALGLVLAVCGGFGAAVVLGSMIQSTAGDLGMFAYMAAVGVAIAWGGWYGADWYDKCDEWFRNWRRGGGE